MTKAQQKRQKIIDTAVRLFVTNGIHTTSMQTLAKEAGVATGSIYTYFDSKDTLVVDALNAVIDEGTDFITKDYDSTQSVKQRFYHLLARKIRYDVDNPDKFRFMTMCFYEPVVMSMVQTDKRCEESALATVLEKGKRENLIKDLPLEDLFYHIFGGAASLLEWRLFNRQVVSDTDIINMIEMSWDAIEIRH